MLTSTKTFRLQANGKIIAGFAHPVPPTQTTRYNRERRRSPHPHVLVRHRGRTPRLRALVPPRCGPRHAHRVAFRASSRRSAQAEVTARSLDREPPGRSRAAHPARPVPAQYLPRFARCVRRGRQSCRRDRPSYRERVRSGGGADAAGVFLYAVDAWGGSARSGGGGRLL